jgi:glucokinase
MIGVDIGGTNLLVGTISNGKVIKRTHEEIKTSGNFELVAQQVCDAIQKLSDDKIDSVGISVAGSVDIENGIVLRAQNLDWDNAPLASYVSSKLQCKVVIENDVTSAAWGEFNFGAGKENSSIFAVWVGTGIGGGLILNNSIWRGPLGTGGEFGMGISEVNPEAPARVLEALASRSGYRDLLNNSTLQTDDLANGFGNDEEITRVLTDGATRIGTAIANAITLLSLDTVVLGGGIIEALGQPYIDLIRSQFDIDVFPPHCRQCKFRITELGPDAGLLGAALLANT